MFLTLDRPAGSSFSGPAPFAAFAFDRSAYEQHRATTAEWATFEKNICSPPSLEDSGLTEKSYRQLLAEVQQITMACIAKPRPERSDVMNNLVQRSVDAALNERGSWNLVPMEDQRRTNGDLRFIFGQVSGVSEHSQFVGAWVIQRGAASKRILFDIVPESKVTKVTPVEEPSVPLHLIKNLVQRGAAPWDVQVEKDSGMGRWLVELFGSSRIGFLKGYESLGVLSEAVVTACQVRQLCHMLLPRSRRDPGTAPWHIGAHLVEKPDSAVGSEVSFTWSDLACDRSSGIPQLVQATVDVTLNCRIQSVLEQKRPRRP